MSAVQQREDVGFDDSLKILQWIEEVSSQVNQTAMQALRTLLTDRVDAGGKVLQQMARLLTQIASDMDNSASNHALDTLVSTGGGPIAALNKKIAAVYGASSARITVSGSSGTNLAAVGIVLPGLLKPDRKTVVVDRDCHISVVGGFVSSGLQVRWIRRRYVEEYDVQAPIDVADVRRVFTERADIGALIITAPTYDGFDAPIEKLASLCKEHGILLIVDSAWGPAHGALAEAGFPRSAVERGADIAVISLHKKGFAPSQIAAALFRSADHAGVFDMAGCLGFQTTSPNYFLLSLAEHSIDQFRDRSLVEPWKKTVKAARILAERIPREIPGSRVIKARDIGADTGDPCHLLVNVAGLKITGRELMHAMNERGFDPEKATKDTVLFLLGPHEADDDAGFLEELKAAVADSTSKAPASNGKPSSLVIPSAMPEVVCTIREAVIGATKEVALDSAAGEVAAHVIAVYPPGTALVVPGERITGDHIAYIKTVFAGGGNVRGVDGTHPVLRVAQFSK